MKLVVSIAPRSMNEALSALARLRRSRDLVELRIDRLRGLDLQRLLARPRPRVIITDRHVSEGGWSRSTPGARAGILSEALRLGAEYVDIELRTGGSHIRRLLALSSRGRLIVSYHDVEKTPPGLKTILNRLYASGGHVLKLVTTARDISDNRKIFDLLNRHRRNGRLVSAFCMTDRGEVSRILAPRFGGEFTYASSTHHESTAPGQLTADDLKRIYRIGSLNRRSKVFGLVGNPVRSSKGYLYHNRRFALHSLNAVYVNFLVDDLRSFIGSFGDLVSGFSVTMPFKEAIIPLLDNVEDEAVRLQSVNTVLRMRGRLVGCNTDYPAIRSILKRGGSLRGKRAIVLGTGGTARTMALAAIEAGAFTTIIGRSPERAERAARLLSCSWALFRDMPSLGADLLMNGTPVGMAPGASRSPVPPRWLRGGMTVFDAVYDPPLTTLLRNARSRGCRIFSGAQLFRGQAALQSSMFIGAIAGKKGS